jgi:hypothetical protein
MPMMLMSGMFGGGATGDGFGDFANMFDFELDEAPEEEDEGEESIEELEAKLAAAKAKKANANKAE